MLFPLGIPRREGHGTSAITNLNANHRGLRGGASASASYGAPPKLPIRSGCRHVRRARSCERARGTTSSAEALNFDGLLCAIAGAKSREGSHCLAILSVNVNSTINVDRVSASCLAAELARPSVAKLTTTERKPNIHYPLPAARPERSFDRVWRAHERRI